MSRRAALCTDSQLAATDKELIAAFASALNAYQYCYDVHKETAKAFGVDESLMQPLLADADHAPVDTKLATPALLAYAGILTLNPTKATQRDVEAVFATGWTERDLHDAVLTVCLFTFVNRLLEGRRVKGNPGLFVQRSQALKDAGYSPLLAMQAEPTPPEPLNPRASG